MAQPSQDPNWNTGGANRVDPSSGQKISGWTVNQAPPSSYFNWWMNLVYQWCIYLKNLTSEALTWTGAAIFNAAVSTTAGLTATRTAANTTAITATGNGTGHGLAANTSSNVASRGVNAVSTTIGGIAIEGAAVTGAVPGGNVGLYGRGNTSGVTGWGNGNGTGVAGFSGPTAPSSIGMGGFGAGVAAYASGAAAIALRADRDVSTGASPQDTAWLMGAAPGALNTHVGGRAAWIKGGGNDDQFNDLEGAGGDGALIEGGNAYGSSLNPAAVINAGHGATIKGGDVDSGYTTGTPGDALHLIAGIDVGSGAIFGKALVATGEVVVNGQHTQNGPVKFTSSNVAANVAQTNQITPGLVVKAWARVSISSGTYTIVAGQNVTSVSAGASPTTGQLKVNLASPVARATRAIIAFTDIPSREVHPYDVGATLGANDSTVTFEALNIASDGTQTTLNLTTNSINFYVMIMGLQ
jgi:hypothetical protein